ncbi:glycoside hydrolase family 15 protein [Carboxydothermus ferrireducens]|uniref:GH15 family glucan-1,4-alpha-glucosidase n=1 Tax=Carboxydothermus ferrireducens DSM 11255 TaxID=1119529 RepID=A0ABX2RB38_9THEO|nr:glycoside hydrolase family 15 protein [Carboxydothermus ferrireducens]NYE58382.1 GH15 family glucan-1,4-alpha-glucosidase [Carboxydothermus ferrireducens DSM 11255]
MEKKGWAIIGNGITAALIDSEAKICWLCLPKFDGLPVFAKALSPQVGGGITLKLGEKTFTKDQRYLGKGAVLETIIVSNSGEYRVVDYMPWGKNLLVREVFGDVAKIEVEVELTKFNHLEFAVKKTEQQWQVQGPGVSFFIDFRKISDDRLQIVLSYGNNLEQAYQALVKISDRELFEVMAFWERWFLPKKELKNVPASWQEFYERSLMVLKLLTYEPTGAIIAAPTASFPAYPNGEDNWDYRFCWLRDGFYTAYAFDLAGFHQESRKFYEFSLKLLEKADHFENPLYTIEGLCSYEIILPELSGPEGEKPIRFGNKAAEQLQLDNEGNIVYGLWKHWLFTRDANFLAEAYPKIKKALEFTARNWDKPEHGIWEFRDKKRQWVFGKVMCYAGMIAGAKIASALKDYPRAREYLKIAGEIKENLLSRGYSEEKQAFLQHYGPDAPADSSVLAITEFGVLPAMDERMINTVKYIEQKLNFHGAVLRFEGAVLPFYLCTFWLIRQYLRMGCLEKAEKFLERTLKSASPLKLMAEHYDPRTGEQWGNFPQGFSHEELVRTLIFYDNTIGKQERYGG